MDDRTHVGLGQIFGPEATLDKSAVEHDVKIDGDSLDEGPAVGGGPAQTTSDAHASGSSACFLPSNRLKLRFQSRSLFQDLVAERVGFEPTEGMTLRRFSRPVP
jgi:hypothetical protein